MKSATFIPLLVLACAAGGGRCALAEQGIYTFVDAAGAINLSNVPDDQRYALLVAPAPAPGEAARAQALPADARAWLRYRDVIVACASRYRVDAALLRAVIRAESGYDPQAVSRRGAAGLMQLMPATARRLGVSNVFDPEENIGGGARYLVELLQRFDNDLSLTLAAYNAGEGAVLKYGRRIPPYRETTAYVERVVRYYHQYRAQM